MDKKKVVMRQSGVALWRQIADGIRQSISHGDYDAAMMLPSESTLAEHFGVNRHTVRSALAALANEGIVRPIQGVGTAIARTRRLKLPITRRTRFSEGIGTQAAQKTAQLISHRLELASEDISHALGLNESASCIVLETLHKADGKPISIATNWFDAKRFGSIAESMMRTSSISAALAEGGVSDYIRQSTEISANHANATDIETLQLSPGAIILEAISINALPDGQPIQYARTRFAADRVSLLITSQP
jgi:GntR family transcriptional regulator, phosphonate transport system regulatory protein